MADTFSRAERSRIMAAVRSRGNRSTEERLVTLFRLHHITGWRRGSRLPARPDFVFPRSRVAVFVDGCFWHGCPRHCRMPSSNAAYWERKIGSNRLRDLRQRRALRAAGWKVVRVWEHSLSKPELLLKRLRKSLVA